MSKAAASNSIGGHAVNFTNPDKVLYPKTGFTKGEVIQYYLAIAPILLPHLKERALTLKRYPNGVDQPFFYEKRCPAHRPDWVKTAAYPSDSKGTIDFCTVNDAATLAWVANLASIELHTLLSKARNPDRPTTMVFDLDPGPGANVLDCARVALRMRDMLQHLNLQCFPKTSGGKGIHLWAPLNSAVTFDQTKPFSHGVALLMEREDPARITSNMRKDLRPGKVFIDWSQNDAHKTTACAYSLRAREEPTVSTPVSWEEVARAIAKRDASKLLFHAQDLLPRIKKLGDLFEPVLTLKQRLPKNAGI